jgi:glycosyltransferase involved in cell wall biosynthesis
VSCPAGNPVALANAIRQLRAMTVDQRRALGANGLRSVEDRYRRDALVGEVADMLTSVAAS